jgi:metal-responsive CopG/Arc/MetJ family transcriptional regulator
MGTTTGIALPEELLDKIDRARQLEGLKTGDTPSRSAWFQRAARQELSAVDADELARLDELTETLA